MNALNGVQLASRMPTNRDRTVGAVPFITEIGVALESSKIVEDIGEAPAWVAEGDPAVVVLRRAPLSEARICRRAPAHDSGARNLHPSVEFLVGCIAPVVVERRLGGVADVGGERRDVRVVRARFDEQHCATGVLAEAGGENTAGRAAADNDDVELHVGRIVGGGRPLFLRYRQRRR